MILRPPHSSPAAVAATSTITLSFLYPSAYLQSTNISHSHHRLTTSLSRRAHLHSARQHHPRSHLLSTLLTRHPPPHRSLQTQTESPSLTDSQLPPQTPSSTPTPSPTPSSQPEPPISSFSLPLPSRPIPPPNPFVPNVSTFLTLIGRSLSQHSSKFPTWSSLFTTSSEKLRKSGIEPPRTRRYLLMWRERFRRGEYGIGGDLVHVKDGEAELRSINVTDGKGNKRVVVLNGFVGETEEDVEGSRAIIWGENTTGGNVGGEAGKSKAVLDKGSEGQGWEEVEGKDGDWGGRRMMGWRFGERKINVRGVKADQVTGGLSGKWVQLVKGSKGRVGRLRVREGLWEIKRGRKIKGGERRRGLWLAAEARKREGKER